MQLVAGRSKIPGMRQQCEEEAGGRWFPGKPWTVGTWQVVAKVARLWQLVLHQTGRALARTPQKLDGPNVPAAPPLRRGTDQVQPARVSEGPARRSHDCVMVPTGFGTLSEHMALVQ